MKNKTFFQKIIYIITFPILLLVKGLVYFYKFCISPLFPGVCKFTPSCSNYFLQSVDNFGFFKGGILGVKRILRCGPWNKNCGYDPVPINIKGEQKWLF